MLREGAEQSSQISQARRETCSHGVESSRVRPTQDRSSQPLPDPQGGVSSDCSRPALVRTTSESARVRSCSRPGSDGLERYAAPRLRLRGRLGRFRADLVRCDLSPTPQPPRQDPNRPRTVCRSTPPTATPAGPSRPRTISAPHDPMAASAGPNRPRAISPLPWKTCFP